MFYFSRSLSSRSKTETAEENHCTKEQALVNNYTMLGRIVNNLYDNGALAYGTRRFPLALYLSRITDPKGNDGSAIRICLEIGVPTHSNAREKVPRLPKASATAVDPTEVDKSGEDRIIVTRKTYIHLSNVGVSRRLAIRLSQLST